MPAPWTPAFWKSENGNSFSVRGGGKEGYFFLFVIFVRHCPLKVRPLGIIGEELVENLLLVFAEREDG